MATGFPVKANYATGDVLTAANMNDLAGTLNYLDPTAKGDLFPASDGSTLTRLAVGSNDQVLTADSTQATGMKWATPAATSGPAFRAYRTTSQQSFSQNTWTKVQFNAENFDTDNCFDSTTNYRFTPTKAGYYQISANIQISKTGSSRSDSVLYKNGSAYGTFYYFQASPGTGFTIGSSQLLYMNGSTDYLEVYVYDSDASSRNVVNSSDSSYFSGVWIRS